MFNYFNKLQWEQFLADTDETPEKIEASQMVNDFFIPDQINIRKFTANYQIIGHGSRELYKMDAKLFEYPDYSKYGTPSIDIFAFSIDRPIGYDKWFIAGYPDVVDWFRNMPEEEIPIIFGTSLGEDCLNGRHKFKFEYLRKMVNAFKNKGNRLECI